MSEKNDDDDENLNICLLFIEDVRSPYLIIPVLTKKKTKLPTLQFLIFKEDFIFMRLITHRCSFHIRYVDAWC